MIEHKPEQYTPTSKFICDQHDKKKYLVHYMFFKFYIRMGMITDKAHKVISFKQSFWLKKYIDFCSTREALSKTDSAIALYKSLALSFIGKTMKNIKERGNVQFIQICDVEKLIKAQSNFF